MLTRRQANYAAAHDANVWALNQDNPSEFARLWDRVVAALMEQAGLNYEYPGDLNLPEGFTAAELFARPYLVAALCAEEICTSNYGESTISFSPTTVYRIHNGPTGPQFLTVSYSDRQAMEQDVTRGDYDNAPVDTDRLCLEDQLRQLDLTGSYGYVATDFAKDSYGIGRWFREHWSYAGAGEPETEEIVP